MIVILSLVNGRNEQLRDGLLSLAHSLSAIENKLERHEQRERALGDTMKRGLQILTKGQKIFEPVRGSLTRLDERINQIETALLNQDTKIFEQQQKYEKAIESVDKWLSVNIPSGSGADPAAVNELVEHVKALRSEVGAITAKQEAVQHSTDAKTTEIEKVLSDLNEQMKQVYLTSPLGAPPTQSSHGSAWEERTSGDLQELRQQIAGIQCGAGSGSVDKDLLNAINNQTLDAIADMRHEVLTASDKNFLKTTGSVREIADKLEKTVNEILKNDGETTSPESFCEGVSNNVRDIKRDTAELQKLEQMLAQMGDNVLSVKRGMEYNVHAVTIGVAEAIKSNSKELNSTINAKFEEINTTISNNHNGALANLTSKIETEISQVWRQIGIMYQEVSASKTALTKLQELTEVYVNGTFATMDSMEGKVTAF